MNSTRKGLYIADLGSDDGSRLTVDGVLIYNNWVPQAFSSKPRVLMSFTGSSPLVYEYFEDYINNRVVFLNLTLIAGNSLTTNTTQTICQGNSGSAISGDVFGTLPSGISLTGTGYQWTYSTTPTGARINISGATGPTYTPTTASPPFNTAGTYYLYRNMKLSSINNVSPNPYIASNESNAAVLIISPQPASVISYTGSPFCQSITTPQVVTLTGTTGGVFSASPTGLTINPLSGAITPSSSLTGTFTVTYTIAPSNGCSAFSTTTPVTVVPVPSASISYPGTPYCSNTGLVPVLFSGTTGGIFSYSDAHFSS
jgi:hypothetical protein